MIKWKRWFSEYSVEISIFSAIGAIIIAVMVGYIVNNNTNKSMIGKRRSDIIEKFGPPTANCPTGNDSEVIEWRSYTPGYYQTTWNSDGRGGGYVSTYWVPPCESVRRAVVSDGVVKSCEGGF